MLFNVCLSQSVGYALDGANRNKATKCIATYCVWLGLIRWQKMCLVSRILPVVAVALLMVH